MLRIQRSDRRRAGMIFLPLAMVLGTLVAGCGQGVGNGVETNIVELDTEGVGNFSADMADCVRLTSGVDVADDFLVSEKRIPVDIAALPPEVSQPLVACIAKVDGIPNDVIVVTDDAG